MAKRRSSKQGKVAPSAPMRRTTGIHNVVTSMEERVGASQPKKSGSFDLSLGMRYSLLLGSIVLAITLIGSVTIARGVNRAIEMDVVDNTVETAKALGTAAQALIEAGGTGLLDLGMMTRHGLSPSAELIVATVTDARSDRSLGRVLGRDQRNPVFTASRVIRSEPGIEVLMGRVDRRPVVQATLDVFSSRIEGQIARVVVIRSAARIDSVTTDAWFPLAGLGLVGLAGGVLVSFFMAGKTGQVFGQLAVEKRRMNKQLGRAKKVEEEVERIEHDLDAAKEIQVHLLPPKIPQIGPYDIFPFYKAAKQVGGDYYDFFAVDKQRLAMVVADVSGKGIPGSMVMAQTRTLLHLLGPQYANAPEILKQTNYVIHKDIRRGMFVTAMLAILDVHSREMTVCSAGHNPMVVFREKTGDIELVNPNGIALGFDRGPIFDRTLQERKISLECGDRVVMYTDGVVEAMSPEHEEYGDDRFYDFVRAHARMKSKDFVLALVGDLAKHQGSAEQHDDITVSTFKVLE